MNIPFVLGIAWIAFWVGDGVASVGQSTSCLTYTWNLPVGLLTMCGIPFVLGLWAGLSDA